jgi:carboxylesterase
MPPIDENIDLDGTLINDSSLTHPENFLLSASIPNPTPADLATPVVICVHGFTACTFEWSEFRDFAKQSGTFYTSQVLMGGHGRDYEDFRSASWEDWQQPLITEYNNLREMGYQNIYLTGASTGCPIILDAIHQQKINTDVLKKLFFVDPIVIPSAKILTLSGVVGPLISYSPVSNMAPGENGFWYKYRPYQALKELNRITRFTRKELQKGIELPNGVELTVFKSKKDGAADPASAVLLKKGIVDGNGNEITVNMYDSELHVMSRLAGRSSVTQQDIQNRNKIFNEIKNKL